MGLQEGVLESRVSDEVPENNFNLSALDVVRLSLGYPHKPLDVLRKVYLCLLAQYDYNVSKVTEQLGVSRPTVYKTLRILEINVKNEKSKKTSA